MKKGNSEYIIVSTKYGECYVRERHYKNGVIPTIQTAVNKNQYFINRTIEIHGEKYDYSKINYINAHNKICIYCHTHDDFLITPKDHLRGQGCVKCGRISISKHRSNNPSGWNLRNWIKASEKSKYFDSFKCYIIRIFDNNEEFIKIGRTYNKVNWRFRNNKLLPYKYEIIKEIEGTPKFILDKETELKNKLKEFRYLPKKNFCGKFECFRVECLGNM